MALVYVITLDPHDTATGNVLAVYATQEGGKRYVDTLADQSAYPALTDWIADGESIKRQYVTRFEGKVWLRIVPFNVVE